MNGAPNWHKYPYEGIVVKDFFKDNGQRYFNTSKTNENPAHMVRSPFYKLKLRM